MTCQTGYQAVLGLCKKIPDYCSQINNGLVCIQCINGYTLYNGVCYRIIPNCLTQLGFQCAKCDNLFVLSNDQRSCISKQPIRYCQQHDSTY